MDDGCVDSLWGEAKKGKIVVSELIAVLLLRYVTRHCLSVWLFIFDPQLP